MDCVCVTAVPGPSFKPHPNNRCRIGIASLGLASWLVGSARRGPLIWCARRAAAPRLKLKAAADGLTLRPPRQASPWLGPARSTTLTDAFDALYCQAPPVPPRHRHAKVGVKAATNALIGAYKRLWNELRTWQTSKYRLLPRRSARRPFANRQRRVQSAPRPPLFGGPRPPAFGGPQPPATPKAMICCQPFRLVNWQICWAS